MSSICNTIYNTLKLAEKSRYPFLLMSPPGFGKTTIIKNWAAANGYHCEILNGARFEPEAIEGYQVNEPGCESLVHKNPSWFSRIWENHNKGIPSVLFEDELSGARIQTQNAMLNLNFDRTIGENKYLPEDTIIIAASNYADNISSTNKIISANLNRFCIINLLEDLDPQDLLKEFLTDIDSKIKYNSKPKAEVTDEIVNTFTEKFSEFSKNLVKEYSDTSSSKGYIDILAPNIQDIFSDCAQNALYNFLSPRTISNLKRILLDYLALDIKDNDFLKKVIKGFIGFGTGHFVNSSQIKSYNTVVFNSIKTIMQETSGIITKSAKVTSNTEDISDLVNEIRVYKEENKSLSKDTRIVKEELMNALVQNVTKKYSKIGATLLKISNDKQAKAEFIADYESIFELLYTEDIVPSEIVTFAQCFDAYYSQLIGKKTFPNVSDQEAFRNYKSSLYRCSVLAIRNDLEIPSSEKEIEDFVKYEKILQVGVTVNLSKKLYKMLYNTSVYGDSIFDVVEDYSILIFEDGSLVKKNWTELRDKLLKK